MKKGYVPSIILILCSSFFLIPSNLSLAQQKKNRSTERTSSKLKRIRTELRTRQISFDFDDVPLKKVMDYFEERVSFKILVDPGVDTRQHVNMRLQDVSLKQALKLLLGQFGLTAKLKQGIVRIQKEGENKSQNTLIYDVSDLLAGKKQFAGPNLKMANQKKGSSNGKKSDQTRAIQPGRETEGSVVGSVFEYNMPEVEEGLVKKPADLKNMIQQLTSANWEGKDKCCSLKIKEGLLIVNAPPDVQREVQFFISRFRKTK